MVIAGSTSSSQAMTSVSVAVPALTLLLTVSDPQATAAMAAVVATLWRMTGQLTLMMLVPLISCPAGALYDEPVGMDPSIVKKFEFQSDRSRRRVAEFEGAELVDQC